MNDFQVVMLLIGVILFTLIIESFGYTTTRMRLVSTAKKPVAAACAMDVDAASISPTCILYFTKGSAK